MELILKRRYWPNGTNGSLIHGDNIVCYTIELPWKNNSRNSSCIPEGRYPLQRVFSARHGWHLRVNHVVGRSGILFHPANNASKELRGCIAPVSVLAEPGTGYSSKAAFFKLNTMVQKATKNNEQIFLTIIKEVINDGHITTKAAI